MKQKTLSQLIKENKFDWVNPDITEKNFPPQTVNKNFKVFHFGKIMTTEQVIAEMDKENYQPANIYELLSWRKWNGKDCIITLGSVCVDSYGCHDVAYLYEDGVGRNLGLSWVGSGWNDSCRFLAVSKSGARTLGNSDLETRVKILEKQMSDLRKFLIF